MTNDQTSKTPKTSNTQPTTKPAARRAWGLIITLIACILVLGAGVLVYRYFMNNPNTAARRAPEKTARLVETITAEIGEHPAMLSAMGETIASTQVQLRPQLNAKIISVSPKLVPGGRFELGEEILKLDPRDFVLALAQRESEIKQAQSQVITAQSNLITAQRELAIEEGSQNIARREFELLGTDIPEEDRSLVLREPQLLAAKAAVESANAAILAAESAVAVAQSRRDQAIIDLERTAVRAPFNAIVMEKNVDVGDIVSASTAMLTLVGTDRAWVELAVPLSETRWIHAPSTSADNQPIPGSPVIINNTTAWGAGLTRQARVIQILPQIKADSRMARVLVEVPDPFAINQHADAPVLPQLLIGSYVQASIVGPTLTNMVRLPRSAVWEGNIVRVMNADDELEIRHITIAFKEPDHVLISEGLAAGERVVTTNLATAVPGQPLRLANSQSQPQNQPQTQAEGDS